MKNIMDMDILNKTVIVRVDYNVPIKNNIITSDLRITESLETINYLLSKNCKIILISHLGKIKSIEDKKNNSLEIVANRLSVLLNKHIYFIKDLDFKRIKNYIDNLSNQDIVLLENTRFYDLENNLESDCSMELAKNYANLADVFINDAFGTLHRKHASNYGISKFLPSCIGFLVKNELDKLSILKNPSYPYIIIMGGAKVSDKIKIIDKLIEKCSYLVVGGAMAFTFLKAQGYNVGNSLVEDDYLEYCNNLLTNFGDKIILPIDFKTNTNKESTTFVNKKISDFNSSDIGLDLGYDSLVKIESLIKNSKLIFWNGPLGYYENEIYKESTLEIIKYIVDNNIKCIIGGGDIVSSTQEYNSKLYHVSTGGGATLEYISSFELVGLSNIE